MKALGQILDLGQPIEPGICQQHGPFPRRQARMGIVGTCGQCREAREREQAERDRRQKLAHRIDRADVPRRFIAKAFDDYKPTTNGQRRALQACRDYAGDVRARIASGACLVLIGPPGVGKTHLLIGMLKAALELDVHGRYTTMAEFLASVKGAWSWHGEEHGRHFINPTLLVMDELRVPELARDRESMLAMLDARYRAGRPTLLASNLTWPAMQAEIGEPFCDRLLEGGGLVVPVDGRSARK